MPESQGVDGRDLTAHLAKLTASQNFLTVLDWVRADQRKVHRILVTATVSKGQCEAQVSLSFQQLPLTGLEGTATGLHSCALPTSGPGAQALACQAASVGPASVSSA